MEEMNQLKVFAVEEANRLIPRLAQLIQELQAKRRAIMSLEVEIDATELVLERNQNGESGVLNTKVEEYNRAVSRFYAMIDEVHESGCFLKDLELGLVDFYTLYQGRVVYLCWKMGEPEISHWHEVGRGFTHRQPIEFDQKPEGESSG